MTPSIGFPGPFYPSTPATPDTQSIFAAGVKQGREEAGKEYAARTNPRVKIYDELRELVAAGDIVIRKVSNGFIIRRIPSYGGGSIETWVVEGDDIKSVVDQLTAIQATDAMAPPTDRVENNLANGMAAMLDMSPNRSWINRAGGQIAVSIDKSILAGITAFDVVPKP